MALYFTFRLRNSHWSTKSLQSNTAVNVKRENINYLPNIAIPENVEAFINIEEALKRVEKAIRGRKSTAALDSEGVAEPVVA